MKYDLYTLNVTVPASTEHEEKRVALHFVTQTATYFARSENGRWRLISAEILGSAATPAGVIYSIGCIFQNDTQAAQFPELPVAQPQKAPGPELVTEEPVEPDGTALEPPKKEKEKRKA